MPSPVLPPTFLTPVSIEDTEGRQNHNTSKKRYTLMPALNAIRLGGSSAKEQPVVDAKVEKVKSKKVNKSKSIELVRSISKAGMLRPKRIPTIYRQDTRLFIDPFESPSALQAHFKENQEEADVESQERHGPMPSVPEAAEDSAEQQVEEGRFLDIPEGPDDSDMISSETLDKSRLSRHNTWSPRDFRAFQEKHVSLREEVTPLRRSHDSARPQIRVLIPGKIEDVSPQPYIVDQIESHSNFMTPSISPPSTNTPAHGRGIESAMRMSVVSPMTALDMPRPKRPFLRLSIPITSEGGEFWNDVQTAMAPKAEPAPVSSEEEVSSDENADYDPRPSESSVSPEETELPEEIELAFDQSDNARFSVVSTAARRMNHATEENQLASARETNPTKSSTLSKPLISLNKPLPPVPMDSDDDDEIDFDTLGVQTAQKITLEIPSPLSFNLQPKPSLNDLEALDNDFRRSASPMRPHTAPEHESPTMDQAADELDKHLSSMMTSPLSSKIGSPLSVKIRDRLDLESPLQISRSLGDMVPTRAAPPPPIVVSPAESSKSNKLQKRDRRSTIYQSIMTPKDLSPSMERKHPSFQSFRALVSRSSNKRSSKSFTSSSSNVSEVEPKPKSAHSIETSNSVELEAVEKRDMAQLPEVHEVSAEELEKGKQKAHPDGDKAKANPERKGSSARSSVESGRSLFSATGTEETEGTAPSPEPAQPEPVELEATPMKTVAILDIVETYANPGQSRNSEILSEGAEKTDFVSANTAESIILMIMEAIDSLQDLFSTATVSKGFYRIFKRHEMHLIKNALFNMSPAAWELREVSPPWSIGTLDDNDEPCPEYTPSLYLRHYSRDMYTMVALKSLIVVHCESFLRVETITGLAGIDERRGAEIDEAFWRVWTFCRIFGCEKNREDDLVGQIDWLDGGVLARQQSANTSSTVIESFGTNSALFDPVPGFGVGNSNGLSTAQLYDVIEIWTCLGVLIQGFHGKIDEAREAGVFDSLPDTEMNREEYEALMLEEWTYYILTLGPSVILRLASVSATGPTSETFEFAKSSGWTTWTPPISGTSRRRFLKDAVSKVYERKLAAEAGHPTTPTCTSTKGHRKNKSMSESRKRQVALAQELRAQQRKGQRPQSKSQDFVPTLARGPKTYAEERPMSHFPEVIEKLSSGKKVKRQSIFPTLPDSPPPPPSIPAQYRLPQTAYQRSRSGSDSDSCSEYGSEPERQTEPRPLPAPATGPAQESEMIPEAQAQPEPEPENETNAEPEPKTEPELESDSDVTPEFSPRAGPDLTPQPAFAPDTDSEDEAEYEARAEEIARPKSRPVTPRNIPVPSESSPRRRSPSPVRVVTSPGYTKATPGRSPPMIASPQQPPSATFLSATSTQNGNSAFSNARAPHHAHSPADSLSPPSATAPYISIATFSTPQACVPAPPPGPQVVDPVDRAMRKMVNELGFTKDEASWALRMCETGERVDVERAVSMLLKRKPADVDPGPKPTGLGIALSGSELPVKSSMELSRVPRAHFASRKGKKGESSAYAAQTSHAGTNGSVQFNTTPEGTKRKPSTRDGWRIFRGKTKITSQ